ncbi:L-type lectin-domain containing receptor kinase IX.1-like, partial [Solanum stenotomum]|uniref:L-type lectin-domain containing receptor kinase IX.1-like n=1 Tax=Solanum stenotomum TaxID=172797 RepID=UPI0020D0C735
LSIQVGSYQYASEVRIISRLRHKYFVQLIGWCHQKRELLLVYEFMLNGSLDHHLFKGKSHLTWPIRLKIAQGLASALFYLHKEWEQCVVHRDIKSSNIMLDSNFNAKLGDIGLARLVDHDKGSQTTVLAGTMGYMAPECVTTGKASKETDVYSFGVVALEVACGRKPIDPKAQEHQVNIIEWAWRLYGMGNLSEAVDPGLSSEFNEEEVEHLLIVGLWCAHPDNKCRPSIRQAIQVLNFEAPLPTLLPNMSVPTYCSYGSTTSFTSPYDSNGPQIYEIHSSGTGDYTGSSNNTVASATSSPSAPLLYTEVEFDRSKESLSELACTKDRVLRMMHASVTEAVELASFRIRDVAILWYEAWERSRGLDAPPAEWEDFSEAFFAHYSPREVREA